MATCNYIPSYISILNVGNPFEHSVWPVYRPILRRVIYRIEEDDSIDTNIYDGFIRDDPSLVDKCTPLLLGIEKGADYAFFVEVSLHYINMGNICLFIVSTRNQTPFALILIPRPSLSLNLSHSFSRTSKIHLREREGLGTRLGKTVQKTDNGGQVRITVLYVLFFFR